MVCVFVRVSACVVPISLVLLYTSALVHIVLGLYLDDIRSAKEHHLNTIILHYESLMRVLCGS